MFYKRYLGGFYYRLREEQNVRTLHTIRIRLYLPSSLEQNRKCHLPSGLSKIPPFFMSSPCPSQRVPDVTPSRPLPPRLYSFTRELRTIPPTRDSEDRAK